MNIDYAIVSADNESSYIEFWPYVSRLWNELVGIKPVLVFICDRNDYVENENYDLHFIKKKQISAHINSIANIKNVCNPIL